MKKILFNAALALVCGVGALTLQSCGDELKPYPWIIDTDDAEEKTEEGAIPTMDVIEGEMKICIPAMLNYSHEPSGSWAPHNYQYNRSNSIDCYAGYWTVTKANFAFGPALPTLYTDNNGYLSGSSDIIVFQQGKNAIMYWDQAKYKGQEEVVPRPEWRALALIAQAYQGHEIVDFFGVAAFDDWRANKRTAPLNYQHGAEVYKQILADLDEAIATLKEVQPGPGDLMRVEGTVENKTMTNWDWRYWVKFANSIKLRMAMNIVDYNDPDPVYGPDSKPFVARKIAEEAVGDEIGVLMPGDRDIAYVSNGTWTACVYFMGKTWNDIRLNASFENILKHFNCPLLEAWYEENSAPIKNKSGVQGPNGIYGVRAGIMMEDTGNALSGGYGPFGVLNSSMEHMDQPFFKVAEATMLRAEGALRGWTMGGSYEDLYNEAISAELRRFGATDAQIAAYLAQDNLPVVEYRDYYNRNNDIMGRVSCGVKLNASDTKEQLLEKIITQKYIINWPMGAEAWTTYRRTGYPRLFPVKFNNMVGVDTELQIRRCTHSITENNVAEIEQITELLGGTNNCGTRVFWDVNSASWGKDANGQIIPDNHL